MKLDEKIWKLVEAAEKENNSPVPDALQGVDKERIRAVLSELDLNHNDLTDAVFALLDSESPSWFPKPPDGAMFCHGATTAHIACHIGILQRREGKLDREGRDYWVKPLRDLSAVEAIYLDPKTKEFKAGHAKAKSPNSAYRLEAGFVELLRAPEKKWKALLKKWASEDAIRGRASAQAEAAALTRKGLDSGHSDLIRASVEHYAARFLKGYEVLYIDDGDGDRITDEEKAKLAEAGIELTLRDAMPDVLLWNRKIDRLWVIEAVTSDGEVDYHKVKQIEELTERAGKTGVDFTTTYLTWKAAASRQGTYRNIAPGTYIWIVEDASKHFKAEAFDVRASD